VPSMIFANADIVLPDRVARGHVAVEDGVIVDIGIGAAVPAGAIDLDGDFLMPGLIDLHTDHLEKHYVPRAAVTWDPVIAAMAHDAQMIGAGVTTVFDCIALSGVKSGIDRGGSYQALLRGLAEAERVGGLRATHLIHLRCELTDGAVPARAAAFDGDPHVRLMSLMDHSPGDRQFPTLELWLERNRLATGLSDAELMVVRDERLAAQTHMAERRAAIVAQAKRNGIAVASHDDANVDHVADAHSLGVALTEFPTTEAAAREAHGCGMAVLMGAPNLVRGGSHVGNLSAGECARLRILDVLASDYVPASLLPAAMMLTTAAYGFTIPEAIATVSANPARATGLDDRGSIAVGLRADLLHVRVTPSAPVIRTVWREGVRVH
jgi:alpha-D-ribose 1-methylphosphonate 5-triphosphate diphosphatase